MALRAGAVARSNEGDGRRVMTSLAFSVVDRWR